MCGSPLPPRLAAAMGDVPCCWGTTLDGPERCTCWEPEYDRDQVAPDTDAAVTTREQMCDSCAYRPGTQAWRKFADQRDQLAVAVDVFWCHDGTRQVLRFRHPNGAVVERVDADEPDTASWDPVFVGDVPYRADGRPALKCAGWAARRKALLASAREVHSMTDVEAKVDE